MPTGQSPQRTLSARPGSKLIDVSQHDLSSEIRDFRNTTTASFNALRQDFVESLIDQRDR